MKISILTLFPQMFSGAFSHSIIKRAVDKNLIEISYINIRDFGIGKHKIVDDTPYGGGAGMLMRVDVVEAAIEKARCVKTSCVERVILLDAGGNVLKQATVNSYTKYDHLILICPHYEGVDQRIHSFIDEAVSIGDYILTGGEIPAMVITDAVVRLLPEVLGNTMSSENESFQLIQKETKHLLLEYPQYTKPLTYKQETVPEILLSGDHKHIAAWKEEESLKRTQKNRPDLLRNS